MFWLLFVGLFGVSAWAGATTDDDADGYTEVQGDCDDTDPSVNPAASDWCRDGLDNDCDGERDPEDCVEDPADGCDPGIALSVSLSQFAADVGATVAVSAQPVFDDDVDTLEFLWEVEAGSVSPQGSSADWTLPPTPGTYTVSVAVNDACGFQAVAHQEVDAQKTADSSLSQIEPEEGGCGGDKAFVFLGVLPLLGVRRRR